MASQGVQLGFAGVSWVAAIYALLDLIAVYQRSEDALTCLLHALTGGGAGQEHQSLAEAAAVPAARSALVRLHHHHGVSSGRQSKGSDMLILHDLLSSGCAPYDARSTVTVTHAARIPVLRVGRNAAAAHSETEATRASRVAITQRMVLDALDGSAATRDEAVSAAIQSTAAASLIPELEALLEDPRVNAVAFAADWLLTEESEGAALISERLKAEGQVKRTFLRQPSVVRKFTIPTGDVPPPLDYPIMLTAEDATALASAAWRRRRAAVLAYWHA